MFQGQLDLQMRLQQLVCEHVATGALPMGVREPVHDLFFDGTHLRRYEVGECRQGAPCTALGF